jgi:hypothetical protein
MGAVAVLVAGAAAPGLAKPKAKQLYKFKFTTKVHMDWQWPVNPYNRGRRDSDSAEVQKGSGCGTSPTKARWQVMVQSGSLPAHSLIIDFIHVNKNPAKVLDSNYSATPTADVQVFLAFSAGKKPKVTFTAKPHGDVVGPTINPATAAISATKVKKC